MVADQPDVYVKIRADLQWRTQAGDNTTEAMQRHQAQHVLNAMALDLEPIVKQILETIIFHRIN